MFLRMHCAIYIYCKYKVLALYNPQSYPRQHNCIFSSVYRTFPLCESVSLVNSRLVQYMDMRVCVYIYNYFFSKGWFDKGLEHRNFAIPFKYQWEYFHIDIFLQYLQLKQLHQLEFEKKNVYNYFDFLQRNAKNKVHKSEMTFNFYSVLCVWNIATLINKLFTMY